MRHIPDGVLRRLDDEPLAVPDRVTDHVARCGHCSARRAEIAGDTDHAARLFSAPQPVPDLDVAWARLRRELESLARTGGAVGRSRPARVRPRRVWFPRVSLRTGLALGAIGIVVAGTAAAATLTTIFAPTHVAPVSLSQSDVRAVAAFTGLGDSHALGGFATPNGSSRLRFGTITWSSGTAYPTSSRAQAAAEAGFPVSLPAHLPAGVGAVQGFMVQPRVYRLGDFQQLHRRWSRRELGDPRRPGRRWSRSTPGPAARTCPPWGSRRCAVRQRSPPARV